MPIFYKHSTKVSCKHLITQQQFKFIVKKLLVATYGNVAATVVSGFGARTLKVQQHPSTFSTLNTLEQVTPGVPQVTSVLVVGISQGVPLPQQVYNITGLVLQPMHVGDPPKNPLSQESKQCSLLQLAFCCKMHITVNISAMHLQPSSLVLLHI